MRVFPSFKVLLISDYNTASSADIKRIANSQQNSKKQSCSKDCYDYKYPSKKRFHNFNYSRTV